MTAVLEVRPSSAGRHRAPEDATTGSMGVLPADLCERSAHEGGSGRRGSSHSHTAETPVLQRAARTAGLSLAALGALATAGGLAVDNLSGPSLGDAPATGEVAASPQLASADLSLAPARQVSSDAATSSVMPVAAAAPAAPAAASVVKHDSPVSRAAARPAAQPARHTASSSSSSSTPAQAAPAAASSVGARALAEARSQLGVPYVWGGTSPSGFDCSGLMQWAFDQVGKDLPRTSAAQSRVGQSISQDELRPGDLIFFHSPVSHVAMYAGNGQMIEAPTQGQDVKMSKTSGRLDDATGFRRL
jgi:cell wall-associated NlpC family hydrolase